MGMFDSLYDFEFSYIPKRIRKDKRKYIGILNDKGQKELFRQFAIFCRIFGCENPYTEEDFSYEILQQDEDLTICRLDFPKPFQEPLCECAYIFLYKKKALFGKKTVVRYFTKEIGRGEDGYFLGERDNICQGTIGPVWFLQQQYAFKDELDFFRKIVMEDLP